MSTTSNPNPSDAAPAHYTPHWSRRVAGGGPGWFGTGVRAPLSMSFGNPDPALFPSEGLAAATTRVLADPAAAAVALQYGSVQGQPRLFSLLSDKMSLEEGLEVRGENIIVTPGASGAIALVARAFADEGDTVLVEGPTWPGALSIFRRNGLHMATMPLGDNGIEVKAIGALLDRLVDEGRRVRVIYTIPTFQNPTGLTLPADDRAGLLDLARRHDLIVLEDDAYRELYFEARESLPPTLYSMDTEGRVVRTGTFSKIMAAGIRLGYAVAQPEIIRRMSLLKDEGGTSPLAQLAAVEYAQNGVLMEHMATLREAYKAKRDAMLSALEQYFPTEARWTRPAGGFFVWVSLPASVEQGRLVALSAEEGVEYLPGEVCFADQPPVPGTYMRLSYSLLTLDEIEEAIKRLGRAAKRLM